MRGRSPHLTPCTPLGIMELLRRTGVEIKGRSCVIVGDSNVVGSPLAVMLRDHGAGTVTVCHRISYSEWFEDQTKVEAMRKTAAACLPRLPGPHTAPDGRKPLDAAGVVGGGEAGLPGVKAHQLPDITRTADLLVVAIG